MCRLLEFALLIYSFSQASKSASDLMVKTHNRKFVEQDMVVGESEIPKVKGEGKLVSTCNA